MSWWSFSWGCQVIRSCHHTRLSCWCHPVVEEANLDTTVSGDVSQAQAKAPGWSLGKVGDPPLSRAPQVLLHHLEFGHLLLTEF